MSNTLQISISNDAWQNHLLSSLKLLRNRNTLCDASLVTQDGATSRAHAVMLAASSPVLYSLLSGTGPEYRVKLEQVADKTIMQHILNFIYEGQITIPIKLLVEVQGAAEKLCITQLSDVCLAILKEMGLGPKQDAIINTTPPAPVVQHPPSKSCVLKVPSVPNATHNNPVTPVNNSKPVAVDVPEEQAIDLSIVKKEKPDNLSPVPPIPVQPPVSVIPPMENVRANVKEKFTGVKESHLKPSENHNAHNALESVKKHVSNDDTKENNAIGIYSTYQSSNSSYDSPLLNHENNNLQFTDEMQAKFDANTDARSQSSSGPQDEDDELIEEMVAEQLLQSRMQRSLGKQPKGMKRFHCRICDSRFTRLDNLRVHIRSIHTGKKPFKCNICDKTFTRAFTLKYHKMSHDGVKPWTCSDCGRGFTRKDYHQEHIRNQICKRNKTASMYATKPNSRTSSPVQDDAHQCQICEAFFASQDSLENHMENCMNETHKWETKSNNSMSLESQSESQVESPPDPDRNQDQEDSECICDVCHTRFLDRDSLFVHQMEHKRQEESFKIEMIAPDAPDGSPCKISRQDEQNLESIKKQMCSRSHFNENFNNNEENQAKSPADLSDKKRHLPSSLRELLGEESISPSPLSSSPSLPSQTRPLSNQCNILDLRKPSLHSDENENLTTDLSLKNRNSTSPMPMVLLKKPTLGENFNCSQENLNSLLSLAKKPFGFINCFNETDENTSMNLLNELKCDASGDASYPPRKKIKQEQPYACDICNARFTRGDNMRVHRRRHFNATKMFTCTECGQAFTRSSSLKTHLSAAHKIDT